MNCLLIAASHRPASLNRTLTRHAAPLLEAEGFAVDAPDYTAFDLPLFNDADRERGIVPPALDGIAQRMAAADALVISSPEYNWSYPGSLKNLIDWVSYLSPCPLARKSALLMSATPSRRGGVMGLAHLQTPLEAIGMYVFPTSFLLADAHLAFDAAGEFTDAAQKKRLSSIIHDFSAFANALHRM